MKNVKKINKYILYLLFLFCSFTSVQAQCIVNAGGGATICGTSHEVKDSSSNDETNLTWTVIEKPDGASNPEIDNPHALKPTIKGLNKPGSYKFKLTKKCSSGEISSLMTVISTGDVSSFTAGNNITDVLATTGTVDLEGVIPEGFTGQWEAVNIEQEYYGYVSAENTSFSDKTKGNSTFSLIRKANHNLDPAYKLRLKITSIYNPYCTYEDEIVVRFVPNVEIELTETVSRYCGYVYGDEKVGVFLKGDSPRFSSLPIGTSGDSNFGNSYNIDIISQPDGGNLSFVEFGVDRFYISVSAIGEYKFTLTITDSKGNSYTTPEIIHEKTGVSPGDVNFVDSDYPDQNMIYSYAGTGAEVICDYVGKKTPITIYFSIDPNDNPNLLETGFSVNFSPNEWNPNFQQSGQGERKRSVTVDAPIDGWKPGTYGVVFSVKSGECSKRNDYFIHISDKNREDLAIDDIVVCYPGTGTVNAVVKLPEIYQQVINETYLKGYDGVYEIKEIGKPEGALEVEFDVETLRTLKNESTIIKNLSKAGEYFFSIKVKGKYDSNKWLLEQEYACSEASMETTFKVIVSEQINANAGSNQSDIFCRTKTVLAGNSPGDVGVGKWTVVSAQPETMPVFDDDTSARTIVDGLDKTGKYIFRWTIETGDCISSSDVEVIVDLDNCKPPKVITNPMISTKTKRR